MRRIISVDVEYLKETNINLRQEIIILGLLLMLNKQVDCYVLNYVKGQILPRKTVQNLLVDHRIIKSTRMIYFF